MTRVVIGVSPSCLTTWPGIGNKVVVIRSVSSCGMIERHWARISGWKQPDGFCELRQRVTIPMAVVSIRGSIGQRLSGRDDVDLALRGF